MIELTEEYKKAAKQFKMKFGYGVPLRMIPPTIKTAELIDKIYRCIESEKDDLLMQLNAVINPNNLI